MPQEPGKDTALDPSVLEVPPDNEDVKSELLRGRSRVIDGQYRTQNQ